MGEKKRGGYTFRSYIGDHGYYHVHILKDNKLIGRWDIENQRKMGSFRITSKMKKALVELGYML